MQKLSNSYWITFAILTFFCQSLFLCHSEAASLKSINDTTWRNPDLVTAQFEPRELYCDLSEKSREQSNTGSSGSQGGDGSNASAGASANSFASIYHLTTNQISAYLQNSTNQPATKLWLVLRSLLL